MCPILIIKGEREEAETLGLPRDFLYVIGHVKLSGLGTGGFVAGAIES